MFEQPELKTALTSIKSVINKRERIPILECVLIDGATITATNLGVTVSYTLTTTGPGAVAINHSELSRLVAAGSRGALVHISPDPARNNVARIDIGDISAPLSTLPAENFPRLSAPGPIAGQWTMPAKYLRQILAACGACVSTDETRETRYCLQGVYFHALGGQLAAVATDGHMLAFRGTDLPWDRADNTEGWIMPTSAVMAAQACFGKRPAGNATNATLTLHDEGDNAGRRVSITCGPWSMTTKIIDGQFPAYYNAVPAICTDPDRCCLFDREAVLGAVIRLGKTMPDRVGCVVLDGAAGTITSSPGGTTTTVTLDGGAGIRSGFNWRYLATVLSGFQCQRIAFSQSGSAEPARFGNPDNLDEVAVVMPMRI